MTLADLVLPNIISRMPPPVRIVIIIFKPSHHHLHCYLPLRRIGRFSRTCVVSESFRFFLLRKIFEPRLLPLPAHLRYARRTSRIHTLNLANHLQTLPRDPQRILDDTLRQGQALVFRPFYHQPVVPGGSVHLLAPAVRRGCCLGDAVGGCCCCCCCSSFCI